MSIVRNSVDIKVGELLGRHFNDALNKMINEVVDELSAKYEKEFRENLKKRVCDATLYFSREFRIHYQTPETVTLEIKVPNFDGESTREGDTNEV